MDKNRMYELGKSRVAQIKTTDVCNRVIIGILTLWAVWASTSVLIDFIR